jgi:uroporphyrinogen-III decarboxylase
MTSEKNSEELAANFQTFLSPPGVQFADTGAEQAYKKRTQMIIDALQLKKPERVPVCLTVGFYPFAYAGVTAREAMYDYDKLASALFKFHADFEPDSLQNAPIYGAGKLFDILDFKLYRWPGHGVPDTAPYQCIESEYMKADEYDRLIDDPSDFFLRFYLPRIFGALEGWSSMAPLTGILELPFFGPYIVPVGNPQVQQSFEKLMEAGRAAQEWIKAAHGADMASRTRLGLPPLIGGITKAPFDAIGDTLRGTRGIMMDMFRRPDKLIAAMERFVPLLVEVGVRTASRAGHPIVFMPLHKGADGFMSNPDFQKFYWPTLKAVILGLVEEGLVPYLFVEGGYNQRLDIVTDPDIPSGRTLWMFDRTDMKEVYRRFKGWACFGGNVPVSMLKAGRPADVEGYVKRLIDEVAGDGGFILSTGAVLDDALPENLHALVRTGKEYGVYR